MIASRDDAKGPLNDAEWLRNRRAVISHCRFRAGRDPDLVIPEGFNDLIQWLKVYDHTDRHVTACDKVAVRDMVARILGDDVLVPQGAWPPASYPCVAKCSHDSGSMVVLNSAADAAAALPRLRRRLRHPYGVSKGEWAYGLVPPRLIVERKLADPVIDFKFHCSGGKICFVQVVWDRTSGTPREAILLPNGSMTDLRTNEVKFVHDPDPEIFPGADTWEMLSDMARSLAAGWRYVRVDLLWAEERPWFGELTLWPRSGFMYERDERVFGDMIRDGVFDEDALQC